MRIDELAEGLSLATTMRWYSRRMSRVVIVPEADVLAVLMDVPDAPGK